MVKRGGKRLKRRVYTLFSSIDIVYVFTTIPLPIYRKMGRRGK